MKMAEVRRMDRIVVVGGGLAASRSCVALRRQGHDGDVVLIAAEPHMPYDRPPLSKGMLHGTCTDPTLPVDLTGLGVQIQLGTAATGFEKRSWCGLPMFTPEYRSIVSLMPMFASRGGAVG